MSLQALGIGRSGMLSQSDKLTVISNNVANTNTDSFKRSRANFEDLFYQAARVPVPDAGGVGPGVGVSFGGGARLSSTQLDFRQGPLRQTGRQLDVAIAGGGFFEVQDAAGNPFYTRAGNFTLDANGEVVMASASGGLPLQPGLVIPPDATAISISPDGTVSVQQGDQVNPIGQLQAVRFQNVEGLEQVGDNLYRESGASGPPQQGVFAEDGFGTLEQGFLEGSNVEPVEEVVDMLESQNAFQLNAEVVRAANERLQIVTQLRQS